MEMGGISRRGNPHHKYTYNGKEKQEAFGLDWHDYEARMYDPVVSRFTTVDPLSEERDWLSVYNFVQNNPINRIDPDGALDFGLSPLDEFNVDKITGEITKVSDKGGSETDFFNVGTTNSEGDFVTEQTLSTERGTGSINSFMFTETGKSTISTFIIPKEGDDITGFFLEPAGPSTTEANQDRRIPEGSFNLESFSGSRFKGVFRLSNEDVPKSRAILIHKGNFPTNTEGCLLPGCTFGKDFVGGARINGQGGSTRKFNEIKGFLNSEGANNIKFNIFNIIPNEK